MATYYVRPDGNDSNTGLGSSAALAWQTFGKAFASGSVVVGGDTVYIAPGTYTENITIAATSPSSEVNIIGDPTASQFSGVNPGFVRLSSFNAAGTLAAFTNTHVIKGTSKNNYTFQNIHFDGNMGTANQAVVYFVTSRYVKFIKCLFTNNSSNYYEFQAMLWLEAPAATAGDFLVDRCIFGANRANHINFTGKSILADTSTIKDSLFISGKVLLNAATVSVYNCTFVGSPDAALQQITGSANAYVTVQNCLFLNNLQALSGTSGFNTQTYCRFAGNNTNLSNFPSSATSQTTGNGGVDIGYTQLNGLNVLPLFASHANSPNASFGNATGAPLVDLYNKSWSGTSPDAGAVTLSSITGAGYYSPTERNSSVMSMQAGSTSRSIYVYLGVTGLTTTTTGLQAYYTKEDGIPVSIPLVAQTPTGAWVAGGFAEVSAINQPGIYRLDIPDAAISAGYNQTVVTVRGASGTNGAVVTIQDPPERGSHIYMGPYKLISNHMGADNPLEVLKGVQAPVDVQLVDNSGGGIDITGATVTAKVYNASSQLIDTYTCTPTYALDGRCSFNLDTTVTDNSGHYTVTVTRQVGGNIVVFGPLRCLVRAN